jgi:hypothetical protein
MKSIKRLRPVAPPDGLATKLPLSNYELPQSEIAGHWMKIAIVVEQRRAVFDAPGPDQEVDCLADCDPAPTTLSDMAPTLIALGRNSSKGCFRNLRAIRWSLK